MDYVPLDGPDDQVFRYFGRPNHATLTSMALLAVGAAGWILSQTTYLFQLHNGSLPPLVANPLQRADTHDFVPRGTYNFLNKKNKKAAKTKVFHPASGIRRVLVQPEKLHIQPGPLTAPILQYKDAPLLLFVYGPVGKKLLLKFNTPVYPPQRPRGLTGAAAAVSGTRLSMEAKKNAGGSRISQELSNNFSPFSSQGPWGGGQRLPAANSFISASVAWVYGAAMVEVKELDGLGIAWNRRGLGRQLAVVAEPTGKPEDILKGWLVTWGLQATVPWQEWTLPPNITIRRGTVHAVQRNGTVQKAFWFFLQHTLHPCPKCHVSFPDGKTLTTHMLGRRKAFECMHCGLNCSTKTTLMLHIRTHTGHKPHVCPECNKTFTRSTHLSGHMRSHTGEKPYKCPDCPKRFADSSHVRVHMKTHSGDKPYQCYQCSANFSQAGNLRTHMRTHSGEKPYTCAECNQSFAQASTLRGHMGTHTGDKPFRCTLCSMAFTQLGPLYAHMRTHTGEAPYTCTVQSCRKPFRTLGALRSHMKTHNT
eukprot:gb/GEZN01004419.1/.p1 GENE.gb/GEZN01004419.1/~~gb/GEZN01004419.1/.p1  ORF type:complete len:533 (-),score=13.37 gb/GEZN01004419.1/:27-1625(-)